MTKLKYNQWQPRRFDVLEDINAFIKMKLLDWRDE